MLITENYLELNKQLHEINPAYGISGQKYVDEVLSLAEHIKPETILDYGCGKGTFKARFMFPDIVKEYDPAIPGKDGPPEPADLVICTDVLEHIEPDCLDDVLADISRLTKKAAYLVVATYPARKTLPDGRNAHLIQRKSDFWDAAVKKHFEEISVLGDTRGNIYYLVKK